MMKIAGICLCFAIVALIEISSLRAQHAKRDLYAFCGFLLLSLLAAILYVLEIPIPNPLHLVNFIFQPAADLVYGLLS